MISIERYRESQPHIRLFLLFLFILIISAGTLLAVTPAKAQGPTAQNVELISQIGGSTEVVFVQRDYAYIGVGSRVAILDITNAAAPAFVGQTAVFPGLVQGLDVSGSYLYVAAGKKGGLRVVDINNPTTPVEVGFYDAPGFAKDVVVVGTTAYIADGATGLRVINVTNPAMPIEIGFYDTPEDARSVTIAQNTAYVADGPGGLRIVDVSSPSAPVEIGAYSNYLVNAEDVAISGDIAYIANGRVLSEGLWIVNLANPTAPVEVGIYESGYRALSVAVVDNLVYLATVWGGMQIIDVANSAAPFKVDTYDITGQKIVDITVTGNRAYAAAAWKGLRIVEVAHLPSVEIGSYTTVGSVRGVDVEGSTVYVAGTRFSTVDWTNPPRPLEMGYDDNGSDLSDVVDVVDDVAYITNGFNGIRIMSVANPSSPVEVGRYDNAFGGRVFDVVAAGDIAYIADGPSLRVIDVTNPAKPIEIGVFNIPASNIALIGSTAYVISSGGEVRVVDVTNPVAPVELGFIDLYDDVIPGYAGLTGVAIAGNTAYITDEVGGLWIVDVSMPTTPTEMGFFDMPSSAWGIATAGNTAYVATSDDGLRVLDISNRAAPVEVSFYETPGAASNVVIQGNLAYVADTDGGLIMLRYKPPTPPNKVTLQAPTTALINATYPVAAIVSPANASKPQAYTWSPEPASGQDTSTATYSWPVTDAQTITVVAANAYGAVTDTQTITLVEPTVSAAIRSTGGQILSTDGSVELDFPNGALTNPTTLTITMANTILRPPDKGFRFANRAFTIAASDANGPLTSFAVPVSLTLIYETYDWKSAGLAFEHILQLHRWNGSEWEIVCDSCPPDTDNNQLIISLNQPGQFALMSTERAVYVPVVLK